MGSPQPSAMLRIIGGADQLEAEEVVPKLL